MRATGTTQKIRIPRMSRLTATEVTKAMTRDVFMLLLLTSFRPGSLVIHREQPVSARAGAISAVTRPVPAGFHL